MDLEKYLEAVICETNATAGVYNGNFFPGTPIHAVPFFGCADRSLYATVGLNPSPAEFQNGRWPMTPLPLRDHLNRLLEYFHNPHVPYYVSWFGGWERALSCLGRSYFCDTAHFDLSPRATAPVARCPDRLTFANMVDVDIQWFFKLAGMPHLRGLFLAGSSWSLTRKGKTRAAYLDEIICKAAARFGFALMKVDVVRHSGPRIAHYNLSRPAGEQIPIFFCGSSPSSNSRNTLFEAVQSNCQLLKNLGF